MKGDQKKKEVTTGHENVEETQNDKHHAYHACKCPAGNQQVDTCLGIPQVEAQLFSNRFHGRLGCVVGRVSRRIGDTLLAASNDNGGGRVRLGRISDYWQEGVDAVKDAKEIGLERLSDG